MFDNAQRMSQPGLLKGSVVPDLPIQVLGDPAKTHDILATTVVGALTNDAKSLDPTSGFWRAVQKDLPKLFPPLKDASVPLLLVNPAALVTQDPDRQPSRQHVQAAESECAGGL